AVSKFTNSYKIHPFIIFLVYFLIRLVILVNYPWYYTPTYDANSYLVHSALPLTNLSTYYFMPFSYLLVLKLALQNMRIIIAMQLLISIADWWIMAVWLYNKL